MAYYQPHSLQCSLHTGVEETLEKAEQKGYRQYLLSASDLQFLKQQLAVLDISNYFQDIQGIDNIHAHSKAELRKPCKERQLNQMKLYLSVTVCMTVKWQNMPDVIVS